MIRNWASDFIDRDNVVRYCVDGETRLALYPGFMGYVLAVTHDGVNADIQGVCYFFIRKPPGEEL